LLCTLNWNFKNKQERLPEHMARFYIKHDVYACLAQSPLKLIGDPVIRLVFVMQAFTSRMPTTESRNPRLPIEVIERAIDLVEDLPYEYDGLNDQDLYSIWKACALTCRAMVPRSQYWLFQKVILRKQSQGRSFMEILRRNPQVAKHTRMLTISRDRDRDDDLGRKSTWTSCISLLLAPKMTNLEELHLRGDIFSDSHPDLAMGLTAFKSISTLSLYGIELSTFGHCARFIRAFPHLKQVSLMYLAWKPAPLSPSNPLRLPSARQGRSQLADLDLWSITLHGSEIVEIVGWLVGTRQHRTLRTLSLEPGSNNAVPKLLRCGTNVQSIFFTTFLDGPISGFEQCTRLRTLQLRSDGGQFPVLAVTSILLAISSRAFERLVVDCEIVEESGESDHEVDYIDAYHKLDGVLCGPTLKRLELTLSLIGPDSSKVIEPWRQKLHRLLPKFCALERYTIESAQTTRPFRWSQ